MLYHPCSYPLITQHTYWIQKSVGGWCTNCNSPAAVRLSLSTGTEFKKIFLNDKRFGAGVQTVTAVLRTSYCDGVIKGRAHTQSSRPVECICQNYGCIYTG